MVIVGGDGVGDVDDDSSGGVCWCCCSYEFSVCLHATTSNIATNV